MPERESQKGWDGSAAAPPCGCITILCGGGSSLAPVLQFCDGGPLEKAATGTLWPLCPTAAFSDGHDTKCFRRIKKAARSRAWTLLLVVQVRGVRSFLLTVGNTRAGSANRDGRRRLFVAAGRPDRKGSAAVVCCRRALPSFALPVGLVQGPPAHRFGAARCGFSVQRRNDVSIGEHPLLFARARAVAVRAFMAGSTVKAMLRAVRAGAPGRPGCSGWRSGLLRRGRQMAFNRGGSSSRRSSHTGRGGADRHKRRGAPKKGEAPRSWARPARELERDSPSAWHSRAPGPGCHSVAVGCRVCSQFQEVVIVCCLRAQHAGSQAASELPGCLFGPSAAIVRAVERSNVLSIRNAKIGPISLHSLSKWPLWCLPVCLCRNILGMT
jgi:hypothetical protein